MIEHTVKNTIGLVHDQGINSLEINSKSWQKNSMGLSQIMVFGVSKQDVLDGSIKSAERLYPVSL